MHISSQMCRSFSRRYQKDGVAGFAGCSPFVCSPPFSILGGLLRPGMLLPGDCTVHCLPVGFGRWRPWQETGGLEGGVWVLFPDLPLDFSALCLAAGLSFHLSFPPLFQVCLGSMSSPCPVSPEQGDRFPPLQVSGSLTIPCLLHLVCSSLRSRLIELPLHSNVWDTLFSTRTRWTHWLHKTL